jgi:hypothetical protein
MQKFRALISALILLLFANCFEIMHYVDFREDGELVVQWSFRFSKVLDEMGNKKEGGLSEQMQKGEKEIPQKLGTVVRNMKVEEIQSEYDHGIRVSFTVPDYLRGDFKNPAAAEFPYVPRFESRDRKLVFHFEKMKNENSDAKTSNSGTDKPAASEQPGTNPMKDQFGKLFLSSVRYKILLGSHIHPVSASLRQGTDEKKLEIQFFGEQSLIDLPLFALYGDKEQSFDVVVDLTPKNWNRKSRWVRRMTDDSKNSIR